MTGIDSYLMSKLFFAMPPEGKKESKMKSDAIFTKMTTGRFRVTMRQTLGRFSIYR